VTVYRRFVYIRGWLQLWLDRF